MRVQPAPVSRSYHVEPRVRPPLLAFMTGRRLTNSELFVSHAYMQIGADAVGGAVPSEKPLNSDMNLVWMWLTDAEHWGQQLARAVCCKRSEPCPVSSAMCTKIELCIYADGYMVNGPLQQEDRIVCCQSALTTSLLSGERGAQHKLFALMQFMCIYNNARTICNHPKG